MGYKIRRVVKSSDIPDWERRPPKYTDLVEAVFNLKPGESLEVVFPVAKDAESARNAVRDTANRKARAIVVRTRVVVDKKEDTATLYLTKVNQAEPVE